MRVPAAGKWIAGNYWFFASKKPVNPLYDFDYVMAAVSRNDGALCVVFIHEQKNLAIADEIHILYLKFQIR